MNRVWKRFFFKLVEPVSFFVYFFATMTLAGHVETLYGKEGFIAVWTIMVFVPVIAVLLRMTWRQAKNEIERENEKMLYALKGK